MVQTSLLIDQYIPIDIRVCYSLETITKFALYYYLYFLTKFKQIQLKIKI